MTRSFYDFRYQYDLTDDEYKTLLPHFKGGFDSSGIGLRFSGDPTSALLIEEIKTLFCTKKQLENDLRLLVHTREDGTILPKVTHIPIIPKLKLEESLKWRWYREPSLFESHMSPMANGDVPMNNLVPPKVSVGHNGVEKGAGCKIAVIDGGFNLSENFPVGAKFDFSETPGYEGADHEHGTKSLSVIKGSQNSIAPDATIFLAAITPNSKETPASIMISMLWAVKYSVDLISISYSLSRKFGAAPRETLLRTINYCMQNNILIICATENNSSHAASALAATGCDNVIAVNGILDNGAISHRPTEYDKYVRYDCAAAAKNIASYANLQDLAETPGEGVSIATPLITAALAIVKERHGLSFLELKKIFLERYCSLPNGENYYLGYGVVQLRSAVT